MAKPKNSAPGKFPKSIVFIVLLLVAVIAAIFIVPRLGSSETREVELQALQLQIAIIEPATGAQLQVWDPLVVSAKALGPRPFTAMELWVNGELAGVQAAPSGGVYPLVAGFNWIPKQVGTYTLIAQAIDIDGVTRASSEVLVFVNENQAESEVSPELQAAAEVLPGVPQGYVPAAQPASAPGGPDAPGSTVLAGSEDDTPAPTTGFKLEGLLFEPTPQQAYCYRSLNGAGWERWPSSGFFEPDFENVFAHNEIIQLQATTMDGKLACWGWLAGALKFLGETEFHTLSDDSQLFIVQDTMVVAGYSLIDELAKLQPRTDLTLPPFTLRRTPSALACGFHLPNDPLFVKLGFCIPEWGLTSFENLGLVETSDTQQYLVWDERECYYDGCMTLAEWEAKAAQEGGELGYEIHEINSWGEWFPDIYSSVIRSDKIMPNMCTGYRTFQVRLWYWPPGEGMHYGPYSNTVGAYCYQYVGSEVTLEVTFEKLTLTQEYSNQELFGFFSIDPFEGANQYINAATWNSKSAQCPDGNEDSYAMLQFGCPQKFSLGSNSLNPRYFCQSSKSSSCTLGDFHLANNKILLTMPEGFGFNLRTLLWLWDDNGPKLLWCKTLSDPMYKTIEEWQALVAEGVKGTMHGTVGIDPGCSVEYSIRVVPQ